MKKLKRITPKQWQRMIDDVLATKTETARQRLQESFERLRMRHQEAGHPVPDPIGCWREELQCAGCGTGLILGTRYLPPQICTDAIKPGPKCKGVYHGRPQNRCGWLTTRTWIFVPDNTLA